MSQHASHTSVTHTETPCTVPHQVKTHTHTLGTAGWLVQTM